MLISLLYLFDGGLLPRIALAAFVHELGHALAIWAMGARVLRLHLGLVGMRIDYEGGRVGYLGEVIIALSGPMANLALAYAASRFGQGAEGEGWFLLSGISLGAAIFNLLPIRQLDGGRALYGLLAYVLGPETAGWIESVLSGVLVVVLFGVGFAVFLWTGWNFTLLTVAIWLVISYCKSRGSAVQYAVREY